VLRQALIVKSEQEGSSSFVQPALAGVDRALSRFQDALSSFAWPQGAPPWFQSRLVTGSSDTEGRLGAITRSGADATPEIKMVSAGFDPAQPSGLEAGDYAFTLSLGGVTEKVGVSLGAGNTWGDVLDKTQGAVNAGELPVRADVVYNNSAFSADPSMAGAGYVLAFSVNPRRADQSLQAQDASGGLLRSLGVTAATNAVGPAQTGPVEVEVRALSLPAFFSSSPVDPGASADSLGFARGRYDLALTTSVSDDTPVAYLSKSFDPAAATTLSPGSYSFTAATDGETRSHQVTVGSGWTWGDVLRATTAEINGQYSQVNVANPTAAAPSTTFSQAGVSARVDSSPIPDPTRQNVTSDGQMAVVQGSVGGNFTLADGSGGLLSALGLTNRLVGTTASYTVGAGDTARDVLTSLGLAAGDAVGDTLSAGQADSPMPSYAVAGMQLQQEAVSLALMQQNRRIGQNLDLAEGSDRALTPLGLAVSAWPGQDGQADLNGVSRVSENNAYSLDQGRLLVTAYDDTGESLPLRVTDGMAQLEDSLGKVTGAYNDLMRAVANNSDILSPLVKATLEAPLAARSQALSGFGVVKTGRQGQVWTNLDAFWQATYADTETARSLFADQQTGLIPAWSRAADSLRSAGQDTWLKPLADFEKSRPNLTCELDLERKNRLIDLLG